MTPPEILMLCVVLLTLPAAARNLTAAGLVASYALGTGAWLLTHQVFSLRVCLLIDMTVLAAIYAKRPAFDCRPYEHEFHRLCAFWLELSYWDRIVVACFGGMWLSYALPLSDSTSWWALFYLALAQFAAAGMESLQDYLAVRSAKADHLKPDPSSGPDLLAGARRGYG
jgi:hypothetical protein